MIFTTPIEALEYLANAALSSKLPHKKHLQIIAATNLIGAALPRPEAKAEEAKPANVPQAPEAPEPPIVGA